MSDQFVSFTSTQTVIAEDGVLAFEFERAYGNLEDDAALPFVTIDVLDAEGTPIAGTLEVAYSQLVLWRPSAPLTTPSLEVHVHVDNVGLASSPDLVECHDDISLDLALAQVGPLSPLDVPDPEPMSEVDVVGLFDNLDALVCCDGAYPRIALGDFVATWREGFCASTVGEARLVAGFSIAELLAADEHDDWAVFLRGGNGWSVRAPMGADEITTWDREPFCAWIDVLSLARGEVVSSEPVCFGDDVADQLGPRDLDPTDELAAQCSGEPYTCESTGLVETSWDPAACEPWPSVADDTGTGGSTSNGDDAGTSDGGTSDGDDAGDSSATEGGPIDPTGDGGTSGPDAEQEPQAVSSCGCTADPRPTDAGWLLVMVGTLLRRRRRSSR